MNKAAFLIPLLIFSIIAIGWTAIDTHKPGNLKTQNSAEQVASTNIVSETDREYLSEAGYTVSIINDDNFFNENHDSGIAIKPDHLATMWNTTIEDYSLELDYSTNYREEEVVVTISVEDQIVGNLTFDDLSQVPNWDNLALAIDTEQLTTTLTTFVTSSRELIEGLSTTYQVSDTLGTRVTSFIASFDTCTPDGEPNKLGYQPCTIEYQDYDSYLKDNNVYIVDPDFNSIIYNADNYQLGYEKRIATDIFGKDQPTIETESELYIDTDGFTQVYPLTEIANRKYLTTEYKQIIGDQENTILKLYNNLEEDFKATISLE